MGIEFFKTEVFEVADNRRVIDDITLPEELELPFKIGQLKTVELSDEAIIQGLAVGNHYHTEESGRWELYVVVGPEGVPLFKVRFRELGQEIQEREMMAGDACIIPPTYSHAFIGLEPGVKLWGISNLRYNPNHDVSDKLF